MNLGTLSYSVNGKSNGVAFTHDLLKNESTVYPAIAFIHNSAITLKTNLDSLVKEINEIKGNILLLNRGRNLPEDISKLFQQFENACKDG